MPDDHEPSGDELRTPDRVHRADPRMRFLVVRDGTTGTSRPVSLADRHALVARFNLNSSVPEEIRTHFDTARNLFVYAWFVYRFNVVAEQHAITSLEFALKVRLRADFGLPQAGAKAPPLSHLLAMARARGLICNEPFGSRREWALFLARERHRQAVLTEAVSKGVQWIEVDDSAVEPTPADWGHDWLAAFGKALPEIRNGYAHGSSKLIPQVASTFDIVTTLINQLYPQNGDQGPPPHSA